MKKFTFLFITSFLFITTTNGQIKKGSIFLGGDLGGSTQKTKTNGTESYKHNGVSISPVFGVAVKENLVFGGIITIGFSEVKSPSNNITEQHNDSYGGGVFIRKYRPFGKSGFYLFLQSNAAFNYNKNKFETNSIVNERKRYTVSVSAYPGISYTVSKRLQLETGFNDLVGLNFFKEKEIVTGLYPSSQRTSGVSINTSLNNLSSLYVGFRVLLNKK